MNRFVKSFAAIGLATSLSACTTETWVVVDTGCQSYQAIRGTEQDYQVISGDLARQILAHNKVWRQRCQPAAE